tara:strand:+ start:35 stop:610 length:576 start_codon:yes stop_codon:yes gene_type:complete
MHFNKKIIKTSEGFTLIELILTVIAIGIFGSITASILGNASKVYKETLNKQKFVSESRHSFFRLNRDLNLQTWPNNDDISSSKSINIKSASNWQLQYNIQSNDHLKLNLIQHPNIDPTSQTVSKLVHYPSSNIFYYNNQNILISDNAESNSVNLAKIGFLFKDEDHGYSLNLESYAYPYNFKFGKPMDYHE